MKSWIILIVLAVAATVTATAALPFLTGDASAGLPPSTGTPAPVEISVDAPHVEVGEPLKHDFGTLAQDVDDRFEWHFKNTGKGTLELRNLGTDCSCTIAQIGKEGPGDKKTMLPVAPGAAEPIELKWNTRRVDGGYRKTARIGTNDPRNPVVTLAVEGKVYPAVIVIPGDSLVAFQTVSNDEDVVRKAALYSKDRPDMKITRVSCLNDKLIQVKAEPMGEDDLKALKITAGTAITITLKPSDKLGPFDEEVLIQTDHPEKPEVRLHVRGRITGPITFSPERLFIHDANTVDGGSTTSTVWVRGRSGTSVTVESAPPHVQVSFAPLPQAAGVAGTKLQMKVTVPPGSPAEQFQGDIVLKTDHPKAAEIRIPLDVVVQSKN